MITGPAGFACSTVPATIACSGGTIAAGASATLTVTGTVAASPASLTLLNTAEVRADTADPDPSNNADAATVQARPQADIGVTKVWGGTADPFTPQSVSAADSDVRVLLSVTNFGPSPATGVVLRDPLPGRRHVYLQRPGGVHGRSQRRHLQRGRAGVGGDLHRARDRARPDRRRRHDARQHGDRHRDPARSGRLQQQCHRPADGRNRGRPRRAEGGQHRPPRGGRQRELHHGRHEQRAESGRRCPGDRYLAGGSDLRVVARLHRGGRGDHVCQRRARRRCDTDADDRGAHRPCRGRDDRDQQCDGLEHDPGSRPGEQHRRGRDRRRAGGEPQHRQTRRSAQRCASSRT